MTSEHTLQANIDELKKQLEGSSPEAAKQAEKTAIQLADQGNMEAAELLSSVYAEGSPTIARDRIREFRYTKRAVELGSDFSRCWLARIQRESGDFASALENARIGHAAGEVLGTNLLVSMMLAGEGEPARPLEALQLLSESVEKGFNTDGAAVLAQIYLEGKYVPKNPQKAYDTLHGIASMYEMLTRHVDPERYAQYLYLKSQAITQGAVPVDGESAAALLARAAELGHGDAVQLKRQGEENEVASARRRDWEAIAHFEAASNKWKMFFNRGYLESSEQQGANHRVLHFRDVDGDHFQATVWSHVKVTKGQPYAVVYVGPEGQDEGVACLVVDPATGKTHATPANVWTSYRDNVSHRTTLLAFGLGGLALLFLSTGNILAMLLAVGCVVGSYKMFKLSTGAYKKALRDAGDYFRRHRAMFD